MAIKSQQLRQSLLFYGAGAAVLIVVFVGWIARTRPTPTMIWVGGLIVAAVELLALFSLSQRLGREVTEPVRAAGAIASRIAGGDLSVTVATHRAEATEVGDLMSSVHSMVVALRRLVGAIRAAADEAAAMATEISASTEEMSASTEEMASTSQDLSRRAGEQAQLVRAAADDAARILQIAAKLAQGAEEAARRNTDLAALARRHKDGLDQSTVRLAKLADEVAKGAEEAEALAQASVKIQSFVVQTKAVATQTNMLALNAAIEAARAGPQGRGFAVVADEVRKLAESAGRSAEQISRLAQEISQRSQHAVAAMKEGIDELGQGREDLARIILSLEEIVNATQAGSERVTSISLAAKEQLAGSDEMVKAIGDIRTVASGNAKSTEEVSRGVDEQAMTTASMAAEAQELTNLSVELQNVVSRFKLE